MGSFLGPNQPPALEIVDARGVGGTGVRVRWAVRDPGGRLAPTHWRLSPWSARGGAPGEEFTTTLQECVIAPALLTSTRATPTGAAREPQRFTVWAVDAAGARSEPATLALFANNVAPTVTITAPAPSSLLRAQTLANVCIVWNGVDPDGATGKPVKYKFELLSLDDPANQVFLANPDSLRRLAVETNWAGWDSTSADTEHLELTNLTLGASYLFTVTGFDDQGDYDPVFSLNKNMLQFTTNYPGIGPQLAISGPAFGAPQPQFSGQPLDPRAVIQTEVAAGTGLAFNWSVNPGFGAFQRGSRWAVDIVDPSDETPRSGPGDLRHWSEWDPATTVTLAPYSPVGNKREEHTLYIEGRSNPSTCVIPGSDMVTLGAVHFVVVHPTFDKDLLVVDDTRLEVDKFPSGSCPASYTRLWPSATELDTFLYARGGVPWRCTLNPPSGVTSVPGILAGYAFDTLGTRGVISGRQTDFDGTLFQSQALPLSVLANYRHVLWLTDGLGALNTGDVTDATSPITAMRFMSGQNSIVNVLTTYVKMGGKLWLAGGGTASASLQTFNRKNNDSGGITRFSSAPAYGEIFPGAMVWEAPHLRSEISLALALQATRALGRFESAPGGYGALPLTMDSRTPGTDPLPPTRTVPSLFYTTTRATEFVTQPNLILEGGESVLDSLYVVQGSNVPIGTGNVAMTVYHGADTGQCIWTGFDLWSFQRSECVQLVDGVLQGIWGLPRAPVVRGPGSAPAFARAAARPPRLPASSLRALARAR